MSDTTPRALTGVVTGPMMVPVSVREVFGVVFDCDACGRRVTSSGFRVEDGDGVRFLGPKCAQKTTGRLPAAGPTPTKGPTMSTPRRTPAEIAVENARHAARMLQKAETRVSKAQEEVEKAAQGLPRARQLLVAALAHPDVPQDVRAELTPENDQLRLDRIDVESDPLAVFPTDEAEAELKDQLAS